MKPEKSSDTVKQIASNHKDVKLFHLKALEAFEAVMRQKSEGRDEVERKLSEFAERKQEFRQLIIDNVNKISRQHQNFTDARSAQIHGRKSIVELIHESRDVRER